MAFYGLSQALIPESDFYKNKQKFLEVFKEEERLLYKSRFQQLGEFITEALLKNSRAKIIESNCNKALKVIEKLQKAIVTTIDRQIDPTIKELKDRQKETYSNLDHSRDKFVSKLKNSVFDAIDRFESDLREEMYVHIDRDIENKECEKIYENKRKQGMKELDRTIEGRVKKCEKQFRKDIQKTIEEFEERIKDSLVMLNYTHTDSGFDFSFNIHSGIDKLGLFASIGGLSLLLVAPVLGEFARAAGIALRAIVIAKSVWSWSSSDYKKSQQKKEVDKNLHQICEKIVQDVKSCIESRKKDIWEKIEKLKANLRPVDNYKRMKRQLKEAHEKLGYISNSINLTILKQGACNE